MDELCRSYLKRRKKLAKWITFKTTKLNNWFFHLSDGGETDDSDDELVWKKERWL